VNLRYLVLRIARHFMPEGMARFLLKHRWIIRPGLESSNPTAAVEQYIKGLEQHNKSIVGKRILVFGYGGRFAVGAELLARGAAHVVLCDHYVLLDHERNLKLLPKYEKYLQRSDGKVLPRAEHITLLHGDIREPKMQAQIPPADLVLSTSVYEHVGDAKGITTALARLTAPQGAHLHYIDLRDHYFKFPFEMLAYSKTVWENFLNPTSNLNRHRLPEYRNFFESHFERVHINVLARQEEEFKKMGNRIRPEFLTGDLSVDSVTLIELFAESPKQEG
jgi:hypothetical protein